MNFGTFTMSKSRKDFECTHCKEVLNQGTFYFGLVYYKRMDDGRKWQSISKVHRDCFAPWVESNWAIREAKAVERRKVEGTIGRPSLDINEDAYRRRNNLFIYLAGHRKALMTGYETRDKDLVHKAKVGMLKVMKELYEGQEIYGPVGKIYLSSSRAENKPRMIKLLVDNEPQEWIKSLSEADGDPRLIIPLLEANVGKVD